MRLQLVLKVFQLIFKLAAGQRLLVHEIQLLGELFPSRLQGCGDVLASFGGQADQLAGIRLGVLAVCGQLLEPALQGARQAFQAHPLAHGVCGGGRVRRGLQAGLLDLSKRFIQELPALGGEVLMRLPLGRRLLPQAPFSVELLLQGLHPGDDRLPRGELLLLQAVQPSLTLRQRRLRLVVGRVVGEIGVPLGAQVGDLVAEALAVVAERGQVFEEFLVAGRHRLQLLERATHLGGVHAEARVLVAFRQASDHAAEPLGAHFRALAADKEALKMGRRPPDLARVSGVRHGLDVPSPGDAHHLCGVVDQRPPALTPQEAKRVRDGGREQVMEEDHRIRGREADDRLRIPSRPGAFVIAVYEDEGPGSRVACGEFGDSLRTSEGEELDLIAHTRSGQGPLDVAQPVGVAKDRIDHLQTAAAGGEMRRRPAAPAADLQAPAPDEQPRIVIEDRRLIPVDEADGGMALVHVPVVAYVASHVRPGRLAWIA